MCDSFKSQSWQRIQGWPAVAGAVVVNTGSRVAAAAAVHSSRQALQVNNCGCWNRQQQQQQ